MGRISWPVKWLLAPALAAGLGYLVIGPRLQGKVRIPDAVKKGVGKFVPLNEAEKNQGPEKTEEVSTSPPPSVTVDAQPVATEEERPRRRRRRRRED